MHNSALNTSSNFFRTYCASQSRDLKVIEIGSYDVNGSTRSTISNNVKEYLGVDFNPGPGVDLVLSDPYKIPIQDNTFDVLVTSSCFEHSEMFWLTFLECLRVVKQDGLIYINVPGPWMCYHKYPIDAWRFYPDSAKALETWGNRNNIPCMVLESYSSIPTAFGECADQVMVFLKNRNYVDLYKTRMLDSLVPYKDFTCGFRFPLTDKFDKGWEYTNYPSPLGVDYEYTIYRK